MHPQYVLENGVDVAHFKYVHNTPIVPVFTRRDFDGPVSYVDFTITFEGDDGQKIEDVNSVVEAINGGLGIAVTKSWGMIDNRTISAITPVDECTSDVRFMVYIGRPSERSATHDPARAEAKANEFEVRLAGNPFDHLGTDVAGDDLENPDRFAHAMPFVLIHRLVVVQSQQSVQ